MHNTVQINKDVIYIGASDRRLSLFENMYPLENGVSYNAYLIKDNRTVLLDTVDASVNHRFFENLKYALNGRKLDYVIVNHMEPDHCATLGELMEKYPEVQVVSNAKVLTMIKQFFDFEIDSRFVTVTEGESFGTGRHEFAFVMAPMVHWPEVMVTYDKTDEILYSADAFGAFGAISGNIWADETDILSTRINDLRRYYTNIVGKYGAQVQMLLKKATGLSIKTICPLHGPVWRQDIDKLIDVYSKWSLYEPEDKTVMIAYASIYGGTENVAEILATELADRGVKNIVMYDVSVTHLSYLISEAFRCSHIVFASPTYNMGIFTNMETFLLDLAAHNFQNRTVAVIENGSWSPVSGKLMKEIIEKMKNMTVLENTVTIKSRMKDSQEEVIRKLADDIEKTL